MSIFEQYEHHGKTVYVFSHLKGMNKKNCMCFSCETFKPGEEDNCPIAKAVFENCVKHHIVTPVYECPVLDEVK